MASTVAAGDTEQHCIVRYVKKHASNAQTKGKICTAAAGLWDTAATSADGPFGVCTTSAGATDTVVEMCLWGLVWATADGSVNPSRPIQMSASTAGEFVDYAASTVANDTTGIKAARDEFKQVIGMYLNEVDEGDGEGGTVQTAIADGGTGLVFLGKIN